MSRKTSIILALLLLLLGLTVLIYPVLSDYISELNGSYAIQEMTSRLSRTERETLTRQRLLAEAYNARLAGAADPDMDDTPYEQIMDFGGGIMAYIDIPQISVSLPIYHGVSEDVLAKGIGHLPETAFPIGGEGNHTVLSGHTGLPSAQLFTDLVELEIGDRFYISALEQTLVYEVDQIKVVLPSEAEDLVPVTGQDYCTLVTCTPYGINSHRLLVRGSRVEGENEETEQLQQTFQDRPMPAVLIAAAIAAGVMLVSILLLMLSGKRR